VKYVEFVGPPGVGKSAIHNELIKKIEFYSGFEKESIKRIMTTKFSRPQNLVFKITPSFITSPLIDSYLKYQFRYRALDEYIKQNPDITKALSLASKIGLSDQARSVDLLKKTIERYQLGKWAINNDEILCLDEGFAQRVLSILLRTPKTNFPFEDYFQNTETPDYLIYVDAPIDVCLARQINRERSLRLKDQMNLEESLKFLRKTCSKIAELSDAETIYIENTSMVQEAAKKIGLQIRDSP